MNVIFFDCDGVFNPHERLPNGYCGLSERLLAQLTHVLIACPSVKLVVSSAWRYMILNGHMDHRGFEYILMIHGAPYQIYNERIVGHTESDEAIAWELGLWPQGEPIDHQWLKEHGCEIRGLQIERWAKANGVKRYAVIDDLELGCSHLWKTNGDYGMTFNDAWGMIAHFKHTTTRKMEMSNRQRARPE